MGPERGERGERPAEGDDRGERGLEGFARRAVEAGVNRMLSTEDGIRAIVGAVLPREVLGRVGDQLDTAKSEAVAAVGREMRSFLANLNVGEELAKILTSVSFEVRMQVRFVPNEDGTLRAQVRSEGAQVRSEASSGGREAARPADAPRAADGPRSSDVAASAADDAVGDVRDDPSARRRGRVRDVVGRLAEATGAVTRAAAEVAAEAAAEVVNRSMAAADRDADRDERDDGGLDGY